MKVLINNIWYNAEDEPIVVFLSKSDRENISNMSEDTKGYYLSFSKNYPKDKIKDILDKCE